jgi:hypothetical protein
MANVAAWTLQRMQVPCNAGLAIVATSPMACGGKLRCSTTLPEQQMAFR